MALEITENEDEEALCIIKTEAQKDKVRQIIEYQKSLYLSSSASSHYLTIAAATASSFTFSCTSNSLLDSTTSLQRLFDMEMATHTEDYSGSPSMEPIENVNCSRSPRGLASEGSFEESAYQNRKQKIGKLSRTKTLTRWRCRGFRLRLRLRHIRIMLCGRIFKTNIMI